MGSKQTKSDSIKPLPKPINNIYPGPEDPQSIFFYVDNFDGRTKFHIFTFAVTNRRGLKPETFWTNQKSYKVIVWSHNYNLDCSRMYPYLRSMVDLIPEPVVIVCYDYPGFGFTKPNEFWMGGCYKALQYVTFDLNSVHKVPLSQMYFIGQGIGATVLAGFIYNSPTTGKAITQPLMFIDANDDLLTEYIYLVKPLNNNITLVAHRSYAEPLNLCNSQQIFSELKNPSEPLWIRSEDLDPNAILNKNTLIEFIPPAFYKNFLTNASANNNHTVVDSNVQAIMSKIFKEECEANVKLKKSLSKDDFGIDFF
jgi:hypothetical protein